MNELFSESTELDRKLGLKETSAIVVGRIIGSGIFRTPSSIFALVGCSSLFYGVWILGGLVSLMGAFCVMEMIAMMPRSGGPYAFLKAAYPPVWTFLRGWAMFFVAETGAIAAVALVFAEYSEFLSKELGGPLFGIAGRTAIALMLVWSWTAANCFGVQLSGRLQVVFSSAKVLALLSVIVAGIALRPDPDHIANNFWPQNGGIGTVLAFFAAMRYGFFAYSGWEGATYVAEEVKNPRRNLPLSLLLGISGVMLLYLAANTGYLLQLTGSEMHAARQYIAADAMRKALGAIGGVLIAAAVMINTFGNVGTQILVKARTWFAMARDGLFFPRLGELSAIYHTPNRALIAQAFWASILLCFASLAKNAYETVIDFFAFTGAFFNVLTFLALFVLRKKFPDAPRPFKMPLYPLPALIAIAVYVMLMISALFTAPLESLSGVALTASGLLYYRYLRKGARSDLLQNH